MLNLTGLESKIKQCFTSTIPGAFETAFLEFQSIETEETKKRAKQFGKTFSDLVSDSWAKQLAAAIDYYLKSGVISGTLITVGSPVTQTCVIPPGLNLGNPAAGAVPNTLGIK